MDAPPPASLEAQQKPPTPGSTHNLPTPILKTLRLMIRPYHPQDAPSMSQHGNSLLVSQHMSLGFPSPYTLSSASTWINMNLSPPFLNWAICESSSPNIVIGGLGIKPGSDVSSHTAEVGFWLGEAFWGKGYVTELLGEFTVWCFRDAEGMGISKLSGMVFEANVGSMRCFEKCGYEREGILKGHAVKGGKSLDIHVFGAVKGDWERKKGGEDCGVLRDHGC